MSPRNTNGKFRPNAQADAQVNTEKEPENKLERFGDKRVEYEKGQSSNPLVGRPAWRVGQPWDPAWGPHPGASRGRAKKGTTLTDLINIALDEKVDCYYGNATHERITRRAIWARHLVDMAVYGQIVLPSKDSLGEGRVVKFGADSYAKHVIKMLRFIEPPVPEIVNPAGVTNIIFDVPVTINKTEAIPSNNQVMLTIDDYEESSEPSEG